MRRNKCSLVTILSQIPPAKRARLMATYIGVKFNDAILMRSRKEVRKILNRDISGSGKCAKHLRGGFAGHKKLA